MGLIFGAAMIAALVVGAPLWILHRVGVRRITSRRLRVTVLAVMVVAGLACFLVLIEPIFSHLFQSTVSQGVSVDIEQYKVPGGPKLPPLTRNITYYSDYTGNEITFPVQEATFRSWTDTNGWPCSEIDSERDVDFYHLKIERTVTNGLTASVYSGDTGFVVLFDRDTDTCYYRYNAW